LTVIPARQYAALVGRERNQDTRHGVLKHRYDLYLRRILCAQGRDLLALTGGTRRHSGKSIVT